MYKTVRDLLDDLDRLIENYGMQVKHFRLYRARADRSREVVILLNHHYAGFAGDDSGNDPKYFLHVFLFEKGEDRWMVNDAPIAWYKEFQVDIRPHVATDFTIGVDANGDIRLMKVCNGVAYILQDAPCLGNTTHYTPAFLHEGRELKSSWFGLD